MVRFFTSTTALGLLASAAASAAPPQPAPAQQVLIQGLHALAASTTGQNQNQQVAPQAQPGDPDQGDDHASDVAILKVCSHDNPSAERSAICPQPNSPP